MIISLVVGSSLSLPNAAEGQELVDTLLSEVAQNLHAAPEKAIRALDQLQEIKSPFSTKQRDRYYVLLSAYLTFRGSYAEQIKLIQSVIDTIDDPESRSNLLYYLSYGYASLGDYHHALLAMNEGILLVPKLKEVTPKIAALQAAVTLFNSLHAYDDSFLFADRIYLLEAKMGNTLAKCMGLADKVEINFMRGDSNQARFLLPEAISVCDAHGSKIISLIIKSLAYIDALNLNYDKVEIETGLSFLLEFSKSNQSSDYVTQLEEAIAHAYLKKGQLTQAERYATQAYQRAKSQNVVQLQEKSSETMAKIKRAQGQSDSAMDYYEINLALKKKVLDDQLQKNLAYQRVKFDTQDKANQLAQMEQKNKLLTIEKQLQHGKNQNLLLMITLAAILLVTLAAWLLRTLQQKNIFRISSQVDGLTQVANRAHFIATATALFNVPENLASVMLLDMDHFKKVNDTYGHATGDWVLKTVCNTIRAQLRRDDLLGRLGGEEFALCLPDMTQAEVLALAERCRAAIEFIDTHASGHAFPISASFGVATRGQHGLGSFEETLAAADKALYVSKSEGRNRISVSQ